MKKNEENQKEMVPMGELYSYLRLIRPKANPHAYAHAQAALLLHTVHHQFRNQSIRNAHMLFDTVPQKRTEVAGKHE